MKTLLAASMMSIFLLTSCAQFSSPTGCNCSASKHKTSCTDCEKHKSSCANKKQCPYAKKDKS